MDLKLVDFLAEECCWIEINVEHDFFENVVEVSSVVGTYDSK